MRAAWETSTAFDRVVFQRDRIEDRPLAFLAGPWELLRAYAQLNRATPATGAKS